MTVVTMLLLSIALLSAVSGFAPAKGPCTIAKWSHPSVSRLQRFVKAGGDFPPEEEAEEYTGEVDWDAEWKKVVASDGKLKSGQDRPGKDFYKSEAEIAAIKAANRATEKALEAGSSIRNSVPDMGSLTSDWKVRP